jgi:hypothetical protein
MAIPKWGVMCRLLLQLKKVQHNSAETTMQCAHILLKVSQKSIVATIFYHQNTIGQAPK